MPRKYAKDIYESSAPLRLNTASGPITTNERAYIKIPCLGESVDVVLVPGKTCALSLGLLVNSGFKFDWSPENEYAPKLYTPEGK